MNNICNKCIRFFQWRGGELKNRKLKNYMWLFEQKEYLKQSFVIQFQKFFKRFSCYQHLPRLPKNFNVRLHIFHRPGLFSSLLWIALKCFNCSTFYHFFCKIFHFISFLFFELYPSNLHFLFILPSKICFHNFSW